MSRIKFSDITPAQRARICNGCGRKGAFVDVPDFIFLASCNHHDFKYWLGAGAALTSWEFWKHPIAQMVVKKNARLKADVQFLAAMIADAEEYHESKDRFIVIAHNYFRAVRLFGAIAFNWGRERTPSDLPI